MGAWVAFQGWTGVFCIGWGMVMAGERAPATTSKQRLQYFLEFMGERERTMVMSAPKGQEQAYREGCWWYPYEPAYCWKRAYGDFDPLTARAAIRKGLVETGRHDNGFRLTQAGREAIGRLEPECDCEAPEPAEGVALVSETCPVHGGTPERWS